jgi:intergrase/recombinase
VAQDKVNYSKKFYQCLLNRDLSRVRDLRDSLRPNVIKALASLSKYLGIYQDFKKMLLDFGLQWIGRSSSDIMIDRLQKVKDPNQIYTWIKETKGARPDLSDLLDLMAYTGLRLSEAINSYNLIIELHGKKKLREYYNDETQTLEHFKHKDTFLRTTKKAFVSFAPRELITRITQNQPTSYDSIHGDFVRDRRPMKFSDIREAHATFMTKYLREAKIDFLHGRCASSVFMRNYFNPALIGDLKARAFQGIQEIRGMIQFPDTRAQNRRTVPANTSICT